MRQPDNRTGLDQSADQLSRAGNSCSFPILHKAEFSGEYCGNLVVNWTNPLIKRSSMIHCNWWQSWASVIFIASPRHVVLPDYRQCCPSSVVKWLIIIPPDNPFLMTYTYCRDADSIILCPALLCCNKMWLVFVVNYRRPLKLSKQPLSAGRQGSLYTIVNLRIERERERGKSQVCFFYKSYVFLGRCTADGACLVGRKLHLLAVSTVLYSVYIFTGVSRRCKKTLRWHCQS